MSAEAGQIASSQVPSDVGSLGRLHQVDAVGDRHERQTASQQRPRAPGTPAREAEHHRHQAEKGDVTDRVGQVHGHLGGVAPARIEHRLERERGRDPGHREGGDHAVEPEVARGMRAARADQQDQPAIGRGVEGEVEGVRRGGDRHLVAVGEDGRPDDLASRPQRQRDPQYQPPCARFPHGGRSQQAGGRRRHRQGVVEARRRRSPSSPRARKRPPCGGRTPAMPRPARPPRSPAAKRVEPWTSSTLCLYRHSGGAPLDSATRDKALPLPAAHREGGARRRRGRLAQADGPRGARTPAGRRHVDLPAGRLARPPQGRADRARGAERDRRPRDADAGAAARRAVAAQRPLSDRGAVQAAGPPRRRPGAGDDPRGGGDLPHRAGDPLLPRPAAAALPLPGQGARRAAPPRRGAAHARVHHEGLLLLRPRPGGPGRLLRPARGRVRPDLRPRRARVVPGGVGRRDDGRLRRARVHGAVRRGGERGGAVGRGLRGQRRDRQRDAQRG